MLYEYEHEYPRIKRCQHISIEEQKERIVLYISLPRKEHTCHAYVQKTSKVHDYRMQKIKHLRWFERLTILFYKRRRYACTCGKRFSENTNFIDR